jgi:hypothetical protein
MKNIEQILKDAGVEITDEQKAAINDGVAKNYKTVAEHDKLAKKLETAEDANKSLQSQVDDLQEAVKAFDGVDVDKLNKAVEDANKRAEDAEKAAEAKIYERDYADALKDAMSAYEFTSEAAKRDVMSQVKAAELKLKNGKLLGLDDLIKDIKASDFTAFVDLEAKKAAEDAKKAADDKKKTEDEAKKKAAESAPKFTDKSGGTPPANPEDKPLFNFRFNPIRDTKKG